MLQYISRSLPGLIALCALACCMLDVQPAFALKSAPSAPATALFYPDEVQVTVEEKLSPEALPSGGTGFLLTLPANVKPDSFLLTVVGAPAGGWYWLNKEQRESLLAGQNKKTARENAALPENETDPARKLLLQSLADLSDELSHLEGALAAVEARLALWAKTLDVYGDHAPIDNAKPLSKVDEAGKLDAAYAKHYPVLYKEREQRRRALHDAAMRREEAQNKLAAYDRRENLEFLAVPFEGKAGEYSLRYSYVLPARAELSYRLNALPDKGEMVVAQDVALTQRSGLAWDKVEVLVSTIRRDTALKPGFIRPWVISLVDKPVPVPTMDANIMAEDVALMPAQTPGLKAEAYAPRKVQDRAPTAPPAPTLEEYATFRLWNLGPRRIDNDSPLRLALEEKSLPVSFLYTLKPSLGPKGFLTAGLDLDEALELPPGMAQFAVDGVSVGRQFFSFNGGKGEIYFGSDPRVTAVMRDLNRSAGEEGFFSKDHTRTRHWQITVTNSRARPIEALVDDPAPDGQDNSIIIKTTSSPKPELVVMDPEQGGAKVLRWAFSVEPGTPMLIDHKVEISAPVNKDKELRTGR